MAPSVTIPEWVSVHAQALSNRSAPPPSQSDPIGEQSPAEATGFGYTLSSSEKVVCRASVVAETGGFGGRKLWGGEEIIPKPLSQ